MITGVNCLQIKHHSCVHVCMQQWCALKLHDIWYKHLHKHTKFYWLTPMVISLIFIFYRIGDYYNHSLKPWNVFILFTCKPKEHTSRTLKKVQLIMGRKFQILHLFSQSYFMRDWLKQLNCIIAHKMLNTQTKFKVDHSLIIQLKFLLLHCACFQNSIRIN